MGYSSESNSIGVSFSPRALPAFVIAAYDSSLKDKMGADYICDGIADEIEINAAFNALNAGGGKIILTSGTFNISSPILMTKGGIFEGQGQSTHIVLSPAANCNMLNIIYNTSQINIQHPKIQDMMLDGNMANQTTGDTAILLTGGTDYPRDITIENVWVDSYKGHGIRATGNAGHHMFFNHCSIEHNTGTAISMEATNAWELTLYDCLLFNNDRGIYCNSTVAKLRINNTRISTNKREGVYSYACQFLTIIGSDINTNSGTTSNTNSDIYIRTGTAFILNNIFTGTKAKYCVEEAVGADGNIIIGNKFAGAVTGMVKIIGANTIVKSNNGFKTQNTGTAIVANGATYIDVAHGLGITPSISNISVTPTNSMGNAAKFFISDVGATTFRINVNADPGATTATFSWQIT